MLTRLITAILTFFTLFACSPNPDTPMTKTSPVSTPTQHQSRVQIERIGVIDDDLAYDSRRGIYVIKDTATGKEFIGVSGVGITEIGRHPVATGKTVILKTDER